MKYLLLILTLVACTKEEKYLDHLQMYKIGKEADKSMELVIPTGITKRLVNCARYIPRCKAGYRVKVKLLEFNALMYENTKQAMKSAASFDGYYAHNWAFDYVKGEPILERYVKKAFGAKEPEL